MEINPVTTILYTTNDIADYLGVRLETIYKYIKKGYLKPIRFINAKYEGRVNYFEESEVKRFLNTPRRKYTKRKKKL